MTYKQMAAASLMAADEAVQRYLQAKEATSADLGRIRSGALAERARLLTATEGLLDGSSKARREFCADLAGTGRMRLCMLFAYADVCKLSYGCVTEALSQCGLL